jgi:hypothetical protein
MRRVKPLVRMTAALVLLAVTAGAADGGAARGQAYLAPFKRDLMAALKSGLASGPAAAIDACRLEAPRIAERYSKDGVRIGRSSHRLRNPDNAPPDWVSPTLEAWLDPAAPREPVVVELGGGRTGYIEAIIAQPLCLACHGEALAPEISAALESQYPQDRATGFREGDLRGVFWVEFPQ